ncbi:hypothetical protein E2C01_032593 [Portunus trituberculatus]|uniref:Uncharacterized protein n=1 Tax=Portunus trituberculatus TaxID=210409 RepID=A0A5B7F1T9_PORTR|nr:hypothetical protein [Portunus trituberculatus]
MEKEDVKTLV